MPTEIQMTKTIPILAISVIIFCLCQCDRLEYHPYDGHIKGETNINEKNIKLIEERCLNKESIRFAFISDTQKDYDNTKRVVKAINERNDIDFVIHGGDVVDLGGTKEFMWMRDILNKLNVSYVTLIGNHDCLANGHEIFNKIFGNPNFAFTAFNIRFICLNTNTEMFDYTTPIPDFSFLEGEIKQLDTTMKTVVVMHAPPYSDQFNNNIARVFQKAIKEFPNLQFCLHGHEHKLGINDLFNDGIIYYGCPNIAKRQYFIFTIHTDKYEYELVDF